MYITHRRDPHFEWFADSFAAQLSQVDLDEPCEVVCVDGLYGSERAARMRSVVADRFPFRHVPAKPTPYAGPHRLTQTDYHAPASARNTGVVYARQRYLVFVDDCSVLMPGWLREVRAAAELRNIVAGAYHFHWEMEVENGSLIRSRVDPFRRTASEPYGVDTRWPIGDDEALVPCHGEQLFGGNFGVPRSLLLEVNGTDELCDTMRGQDYHLGLRLEWTGARLFYSRRMLLIKSEERHEATNTVVTRLNRSLNPAAYMRKLAEFGVRRRSLGGEWDGVHLVLDILHGTHATRSLGNYYELRELEPANLPAIVGRFPSRYWVDNQPLAEM